MSFDPAVADRVCELIAEGLSIRQAAKRENTSAGSFMRWIAQAEVSGNKDLVEHYTRAMKFRADVKFEELDEVSDSAVRAETAIQVAGYRLKADNIKWMIGKMNAKKYGERTTHAGDPDSPLIPADPMAGLTVAELREAIAALGKK